MYKSCSVKKTSSMQKKRKLPQQEASYSTNMFFFSPFGLIIIFISKNYLFIQVHKLLLLFKTVLILFQGNVSNSLSLQNGCILPLSIKVVIQKILSSIPDSEFLWFDKDKPENNLNRKFERWDHNTRSYQNRKITLVT